MVDCPIQYLHGFFSIILLMEERETQTIKNLKPARQKKSKTSCIHKMLGISNNGSFSL